MDKKEIIGWPGYYITSDGELIGKNGAPRKKFIGVSGYYHVTISNGPKFKTFRIHRLVAIYFIPNPENKPQVNHKDCDKLNNNVNNLEWATVSENTKHAYDNGKIDKSILLNNFAPHLGKNSASNSRKSAHKRNKPVNKLSKDGKFVRQYKSITHAAFDMGCSTSLISASIKKRDRAKFAKGFDWELAEESNFVSHSFGII